MYEGTKCGIERNLDTDHWTQSVRIPHTHRFCLKTKKNELMILARERMPEN